MTDNDIKYRQGRSKRMQKVHSLVWWAASYY